MVYFHNELNCNQRRNMSNHLNSDTAEHSLPVIYRQALLQVISLDQLKYESSSVEYQNILKETIARLEKSTELINVLQLFSSNEQIDDIQTSHLKYLLSPAFLGYLTCRLIGPDRLQLVQLAIVYFNDYLQRLFDYKLNPERPSLPTTNDELNDAGQVSTGSSQPPSLEQMAVERADKIRNFAESRQLDTELEQLAYLLKDENEEKADDEVVRGFYLKLIRRWIRTAKDELKSLQLERQMLRMFAGKSGEQVRQGATKKASSSAFKPFIITKNELQKQVYGLGYPSRPTVTIEEFVNTKIDEGSLNVAQG